MAGRSRSSFNKRQKERSRQEKQREKAERKQQRKLDKQTGVSEDAPHADQDTIGFSEDFGEASTAVTVPDSNLEEQE
jgi:hypothetical protein